MRGFVKKYAILHKQLNERPVGQAVKTPPFHGGNMGSSPVRVTSNNLNRTPLKKMRGVRFFFFKRVTSI